MITQDQKDDIISTLGKALECQFSIYGWDDMIKDAMVDFTEEERQWAIENTSCKVYIPTEE